MCGGNIRCFRGMLVERIRPYRIVQFCVTQPLCVGWGQMKFDGLGGQPNDGRGQPATEGQACDRGTAANAAPPATWAISQLVSARTVSRLSFNVRTLFDAICKTPQAAHGGRQ